MVYKFKRLMIVDDSDTDTYITRILIESNQIAKDVYVFENGSKALEYLIKNKDVPEALPELILLDIYMPFVDGFQFLDSLENIESLYIKDCKICIVTSSIDDNDLLKSKLNKNVFSFISKPITAEFLKSL